MAYQLRRNGPGRIEFEPQFAQVGENVVVGSARWLGDDGSRHERFQVLTLRDGKIVDLQDCATRRDADRFARAQTSARA